MTTEQDATKVAQAGRELAASCRCGQVVLEATGAPLVALVCYCSSCQRAGRFLQELPGAPPIVGPDGGTEFINYRKDRVRLVKGAKLLEEHRLVPESPTRRVRATCCQSAMFLDMTKGHWLSMYRGRFPQHAPPVEMRVMTKDRPAGAHLPEDIPIYPGLAGKFMWRLLCARIAMGLRVPRLGY